MKRILSTILMLVALSGFAVDPPVLKTPWTTNSVRSQALAGLGGARGLDTTITNTLTLYRTSTSSYFHIATDDGVTDLAFWPHDDQHGLVINCSKLLDILAPSVQLGQTGGFTHPSMVDELHIQYAGVDPYNHIGFSHQLLWGTFEDVQNSFSYPGIQSSSGGTNWIDYGSGRMGWGTLNFYSQIVTKTTNAIPSLVGTMETNGWTLYGKLQGERGLVPVPATSAVIDFNSTSLIDIQGGGASLALSSTNDGTHNGKIYEQVFVLVRSEGFARTLTYPNWYNSAALPSTLAASNTLSFNLLSTGKGETNKLVSNIVNVNDPSFSWDADALTFFTRSGVTDDQVKGAINYLARQLKATVIDGASLWSLDDAVYPFAGGTSNSHAMNLKGPTFQVVWTASGLTHSATGVKGNGSSGYGDTLYNPSSSGQWSSSDGRIFAFIGSSNSVGFVAACVEDPGTKRMSFSDVFGSGISLFSAVINEAFVGTSAAGNCAVPSAISDGRGPFMGQRIGSTQYLYVRNCPTVTTSGASAGAPNSSIYWLARHWSGFPADNFGDAELRGGSIGHSMTWHQWVAYRNIWHTYNALLNRDTP